MSYGKFVVSVASVAVLSGFGAAAIADMDRGGISEREGLPTSPFEISTIRVEQNATDADIEIVVVAKPESDDGLMRFSVRSPEGNRVVNVRSPASVAGMREFAFESPEPTGGEILALYPEGEYSFLGRSTAGEIFVGFATLSHELPAPVTILFPEQDQVVAAGQLTIQWSQVPDAAGIFLEFENETTAQVLTVNFPGDATSFDVPPSLLIPGSEYQIGIASVAANGNLTFVESQFTVAE